MEYTIVVAGETARLLATDLLGFEGNAAVLELWYAGPADGRTRFQGEAVVTAKNAGEAIGTLTIPDLPFADGARSVRVTLPLSSEVPAPLEVETVLQTQEGTVLDSARVHFAITAADIESLRLAELPAPQATQNPRQYGMLAIVGALIIVAIVAVVIMIKRRNRHLPPAAGAVMVMVGSLLAAAWLFVGSAEAETPVCDVIQLDGGSYCLGDEYDNSIFIPEGGNEFRQQQAACGCETSIEQGLPQTDLSIVTAAPEKVRRGNTLLYNIIVGNNDRQPATGVVVRSYFSVDPSLTFERSIPSGCAVSSNFVECDVGTLQGHEAKAINIRYRVTEGLFCNDTLRHYATTQSTTPDPNQPNNTSSTTETVITCEGPTSGGPPRPGITELAVVVQGSPETIKQGEDVL
ncbi:MAG: hypothetical protein ACRD4B_08120, partial [Acidobacteriota bacterium]